MGSIRTALLVTALVLIAGCSLRKPDVFDVGEFLSRYSGGRTDFVTLRGPVTSVVSDSTFLIGDGQSAIAVLHRGVPLPPNVQPGATVVVTGETMLIDAGGTVRPGLYATEITAAQSTTPAMSAQARRLSPH